MSEITLEQAKNIYDNPASNFGSDAYCGACDVIIEHLEAENARLQKVLKKAINLITLDAGWFAGFPHENKAWEINSAVGRHRELYSFLSAHPEQRGHGDPKEEK